MVKYLVNEFRRKHPTEATGIESSKRAMRRCAVLGAVLPIV